MDATSYTALNQLYEYVSEIQEQQMLMKAFQKNSFQITQNVLANILSYIDFSIDAEKEDDEQVYQLLHTDKETALKQYEDMMSSKEIKYWR